MKPNNSLADGSRLEEEYLKWNRRRSHDVDLEDAFIAGWMAYARIAAREWPDCKVSK
jgi:hypothetical protein